MMSPKLPWGKRQRFQWRELRWPVRGISQLFLGYFTIISHFSLIALKFTSYFSLISLSHLFPTVLRHAYTIIIYLRHSSVTITTPLDNSVYAISRHIGSIMYSSSGVIITSIASLLVAIVIPIVSAQGPGSIPAPTASLQVFVLPVGQEDYNIIQCPNGNIVVFDCGSDGGSYQEILSS